MTETPTLVEALDRLKKRQSVNPDLFYEGATQQEIQVANASLPSPIPLLWQEVLKTYNGFSLSNIDFAPAGEIETTDGDSRLFVQKRAPIGCYLIGEHASGDIVVLDITRQTPDGDCPVVWVSHEDDDIGLGRTIANFLLDWIESDAFYDDPEDAE